MARPLRLEYEGALYRVTGRGNARENIFLDDKDRARFLEILSNVIVRYGWICHGYCLMSNHYHLLIETPEANLSRGMQLLNGVYTQLFNRQHTRVGHVLQGRFKAFLIEKESHLLELARYIVLNPVRAKMVRSARDWRWSSYRATSDQADVPEFLMVDWILSQFDRDPARAVFVPNADLCDKDEGSMYGRSCEQERSWEPMCSWSKYRHFSIRNPLTRRFAGTNALHLVRA